MRYQELTRNINQNIFSPVYCFTGPERYIGEMLEKRLIQNAVTKETALLNIMSFSDKDTSISDILAGCRQYPMMSPYRVVTVGEDCGLWETNDEQSLSALHAYLKDPSPTTILIVKKAKPDKRKKIVKSLMQSSTVVTFDRLNREELTKWIGSRLNRAHKKTTREVVARFIDKIMYLENDSVTMETVDHELNKLVDYSGDNERITLSDLEATLPKSIDENIYRMIDHIMSGKTAEALIMLRHFYLEGEQPIGIFALAVSQLRTILEIRMLQKIGKSPQEIAAAVKRPLFVVKKMITTAKRFEDNRLTQIMIAAGDLDLQMKTGAVDPAPALELFLLKLNGKNISSDL